MQAAKDTFLKTLAGRLAAVNPARTVTLDGTARAAVIADENESGPSSVGQIGKLTAATALPFETFVLHWETAGRAIPEVPLMVLDCKVSYASKGTSSMEGSDRGRILTALDVELLRISEPCQADKCDYTQTPPAALGTKIFWTRPAMTAMHEVNGLLAREATMRIFFFPEAV